MKKSKIKTNLIAFLLIFAVSLTSSLFTQLLLSNALNLISSLIISIVLTTALFALDALNIAKLILKHPARKNNNKGKK